LGWALIEIHESSSARFCSSDGVTLGGLRTDELLLADFYLIELVKAVYQRDFMRKKRALVRD
jgi:hypothetical protein